MTERERDAFLDIAYFHYASQYLEAVQVVISFNRLRGHVINGSTPYVSLDACLLRLNSVGDAKINQLKSGSYTHKVLWL